MIKIDTPEKNLGSIKFGLPVDFTYTLTNTEKDVVRITKLQAKCASCTTAKIGKMSLRPGESTTVEVRFTPGSTGLNSKSIGLYYDTRGSSEYLELKFKSQVHG